MRIGVIADDLTGANATGVRLVKQGFPAATVVHSASVPSGDNYQALIMDTDSRYVRSAIAAKRVTDAMNQLKQWGARMFTKRIDSTLRGNIGVELDTVLAELGESSVAIVMPSFPDSGRTVTGGYLLVDGVPVQDTFVSKDPVSPIITSYVPDLLRKQTKHPVGYVGLHEVMSGRNVILQHVEQLISEGKRLIVIDAVTNEQVDDVAKAVAVIKDQPIVPACPGPFTAAYVRAVTQQQQEDSRLLVAVGSATSLTGRQLDYLITKLDASPIYVNPEPLASYTSTWDEEVERATKAAQEAGKTEKILIVTTYKPGQQLVNLKEKAKQENTSEDALAKRITDGLATISRQVLTSEELSFAGCFTSGGDVTASMCALGRANGIALQDEVLPLAAFGTFVAGYFDGLPVVTKGGLVGDETSIYDCVQYLLAHASKCQLQK
ncbi:four-carbon acid sugar kinase family protein [Halalkalibacterium halodurans]|uniref:four-carbon acid sugar kinase family protein n=1 Tax=Halalkalibacterium halodurans TaxID=86665 RepID=UPI002E2035B8|nr:four-carbon acid sugar kinase family protein [Halalkalibacterium halodurans]